MMSHKGSQSILDTTNCRLGQWYHNDGKIRFEKMPSFAKIEKVHSIIHQEAKESADISKGGYDTKESPLLIKKFIEMEKASNTLFELLDSIITEHHNIENV